MNFERNAPYINARLRARKSRLIGRPELERLVATPSVREVVEFLESSTYGPHVKRAVTLEPHHLKAAEEGIGAGFEADLSEVRDFTRVTEKSAAGYLFSYWDLHNFKAVLRGTYSGERPETILAGCVFGGWIPKPVWAELARSAGLEETAEKIISMDLGVRNPMRRGLSLFKRYDRLADVELRLERWFWEETRDAFNRTIASTNFWTPMRETMRFDIDVRNFNLALVWAAGGEEPEPEMLIDGGDVDAKEFSETDPAKFVEIGEAILPRRFREGFADPLERTDYEDALRRFARGAYMTRRAHLEDDPLSSGLLVGYLWAKRGEAIDLRRIVWGKVMGVEPEVTAANLLAA